MISLEPTKVLGLYRGTNLSDCYVRSINESIKKMKNTLSMWKSRKLTIAGKALVLKSLVISKFLHISNLIPISDEYIKEIEQLLYEFLWNGKTHKVRKSIIVQDYCRGGIKMIDLRTMIAVQKLKWVKLFLNNHKCQWIPLMESLIDVKN